MVDEVCRNFGAGGPSGNGELLETTGVAGLEGLGEGDPPGMEAPSEPSSKRTRLKFFIMKSETVWSFTFELKMSWLSDFCLSVTTCVAA